MAGNERSELLVARFQLGERQAFTELVNAWHAPLWRYLRGMAATFWPRYFTLA
ncbi:hypothetical protein [Streptomyces albicerus]|uniref:hypothetical protein n=1 Tax=Streptomyces albicerus TaxID=2569859 RepID=UPI001788E63C|nr:hypothetical protein [Streptomyces albicerus]